MTKSK
ncbi:hypothetical protein D046_6386A, partial [Vibrio parahaemolyticus V-223/04]